MNSICSHCGKEFSNSSNRNQHLKKAHNLAAKTTQSYKCLEVGCGVVMHRNATLIKHLQHAHGKLIEVFNISFNDMKAFELWKENLEKKLNVKYIRVGTRRSAEYIYFLCNRSSYGTPRMRENAMLKRQMKAQGSRKLDCKCTSQIKVNATRSVLEVTWIKTHYGHSEKELQHVPIPAIDRRNIASKLLSGVTPARILEDVCNGIDENLKRVDLVTRDDIRNIARSFNIEVQKGKRHPDDATSIDMFVQECALNPVKNEVLFYKKQGSEMVGFQVVDFCLILMTRTQVMMARKFGNSVICVDGTHGLNGYDFEMTTALVLDEYGEGFPVAIMFSNRKDTYIYGHFFKTIKIKVGLISPKTFMSDMDEKLYNGWVAAMGPAKHTLFCAWHVDRAWQQNLTTKISSKETRDLVYRALKVLQQDTGEENFEGALNKFIKDLLDEKETQKFGEYFRSVYSGTYKKWAYCYRRGCGINTNMHVENMHKVVKYFYLDRKRIRRLDIGLHAVRQFIKKQAQKSLRKLVMGKRAHPAVFKRHKDAMNSQFKVDQLDGGSFHVHSGPSTYLVSKIGEVCCKRWCSFCGVCVHTYKCTCNDYKARCQRSICKHVHYILQQLKAPVVVEPFCEMEVDSFAKSINSECSKGRNERDNFDELRDLTEQVAKTDYSKLNREMHENCRSIV